MAPKSGKRAFVPRSKVDPSFASTLTFLVTEHKESLRRLTAADYANVELAALALEELLSSILNHVCRIPSNQWQSACQGVVGVDPYTFS
eukprot:1224745-Amphidinium_carterae.1